MKEKNQGEGMQEIKCKEGRVGQVGVLAYDCISVCLHAFTFECVYVCARMI